MSQLFEDLRQEATQSKYEGVPVMSPSEKEAFDKDTDHELWKKSLKFTDRLYRTVFKRKGRR